MYSTETNFKKLFQSPNHSEKKQFMTEIAITKETISSATAILLTLITYKKS